MAVPTVLTGISEAISGSKECEEIISQYLADETILIVVCMQCWTTRWTDHSVGDVNVSSVCRSLLVTYLMVSH